MKGGTAMSSLRCETYKVSEIQTMLGISRTAVYNWIKKPPFNIIKIGKSIRIPKTLFDKWLEGEQ